MVKAAAGYAILRIMMQNCKENTCMKRLLVFPVVVVTLFGLGTAGLMAQKKAPEVRYAKMDKNGDKKLSPEEFLGKKQADKAARLKKRFGKLDKNNDGFLSLEEYKAARKGKGATLV